MAEQPPMERTNQMVQKIETQMICDLDCDGGDVTTEEFTFRGATWEMELCAAHRKDLAEAVARFTDHARRFRSQPGKRSMAQRRYMAEVREWAQSQPDVALRTIGDRGRIPVHAVRAFEQAHKR